MTLRVALAVLAALPAWAASGDALIDAARTDDQAAIAAILRQGADVNARSEDGTTSLAWAANHSNLAIAEQLLNKGAQSRPDE